MFHSKTLFQLSVFLVAHRFTPFVARFLAHNLNSQMAHSDFVALHERKLFKSPLTRLAHPRIRRRTVPVLRFTFAGMLMTFLGVSSTASLLHLRSTTARRVAKNSPPDCFCPASRCRSLPDTSRASPRRRASARRQILHYERASQCLRRCLPSLPLSNSQK